MSFKEFLNEASDLSPEELKLLQVALQHLKEAKATFDKLYDIRRNLGSWRYTGDWGHFREMIQDIISSDHDEAGLEPFLKTLTAEISREPKEPGKPPHRHWLDEPGAI